MRIKEGFQLRTICGENIIVATGFKNIDFSKIISLNESATLLWKGLLDRDFEVKDMVKLLTDEYEVDEATARNDAEAVVKQWQEIGLI